MEYTRPRQNMLSESTKAQCITVSTSCSGCFVKMRSASSAHAFTVAGFKFSRPKIAANFAATRPAASDGPWVEGSGVAEVEDSLESEEIATTCACLEDVLVFVLVVGLGSLSW